MPYAVDVGLQQKRFHSHSVDFKGFKNITEEDIKRIQALVEKNKENSNKSTKRLCSIGGLDYYIKVMQFLLNPFVYKDLPNFDEKLLYLIFSCDPNLITFKEFLLSSITPKKEIEAEENNQKRLLLKKKKFLELEAYVHRVREQIGFYDSKLVKYEGLLYNGLLKNQGFVTDVKTPSLKQLLSKTEIIKSLDRIDDESIRKLREFAEEWLTQAKDPKDLNSLAYNLLNRFQDHSISTYTEQIIAFILAGDPELHLLTIYEEESQFKYVESRSKEELGFYSKDLIRIERLYHDKFEPDKKLSPWTL